MRRLRIVQVGLGGWGLNWAQEVLPTVEAVEVVGYVDMDEAARRRVGAELGTAAAACYASLQEALAKVEAEAVLVTLPMRSHAMATRIALEAGKHVLVEKPFVPTLAEAHELVKFAEARGRTLMVSQNYRFYPASIMAADIVADGRLGELTALSVDFRRHVASTGFRYWDLVHPLLSDMSIHHFDLMRFVGGREIARVSCRTWTPSGSRFTQPSAAFATIELEGGVLVSYRASIDARGPDTAWAGEWAMEFTGGEVAWTSRGNMGARLAPERLAIRPLGADEEPQRLEVPVHIDRAGTIDAFAGAILSGREPPRLSSGRDNVLSLAMVEAAVRSAQRHGVWIEMADVN